MSSKWDGWLGQQFFLFMIVSDVVVFVELEDIDEKWDRNKQMFRARGCCHLWAHHGVSNTIGAASAAGQTM